MFFSRFFCAIPSLPFVPKTGEMLLRKVRLQSMFQALSKTREILPVFLMHFLCSYEGEMLPVLLKICF